MTSNFYSADEGIYLYNLDRQSIIESLTVDDICKFLEHLKIPYDKTNKYIICPTVCHNPLNEAESMKLYYYPNNKVFHCYTECNESMTVIELYKKFMALNYDEKISEQEAENFVKQFLTKITIKEKDASKNSLLIERSQYYNEKTFIELKEYSEKVLECFKEYYHPSWLKDGISKEAMKKFQIKFSITENRIIIPHFDINGKLIGIRARALEEEDISYGKYKPEKVGDIDYAHNLSYNLYGIDKHKEAIKKFKRAVIVESEKSVLLDETYYGKNSTAVACCGSNINKLQIWLLTQQLGVSEIVIALDKEYDDWHSSEAIKYRKKITDICNKYKIQANMSYIFDKKNLLNKKDAPHDRGKEIYEKLFNERIKV